MAIAYKSAGTGATTEGTNVNLQPLCPSNVVANDILILHCWYEGTTVSPETPSGWTLLSGPYTVESAYRHWVFGKIAVGNESSTAISLGGQTTTSMRTARIISFSGWEFGTIEQNVSGFSHISNASDPQMPTVTTLQAGHLAVTLVGQADDNTQTTGATGSTGGNWVARSNYLQSATTPDSALTIYDCTPTANPGTVTGGAISTANDPCGTIGFSIGYLNLVPNAPTLTAPADVATNQSITPTLSFNATDTESNALEYEVQIDTVNTFDSGTVIVDSYPLNGTPDNISLGYLNTRFSQSFTGNGSLITHASFYFNGKFGNPIGSVRAKIYSHTGIFGTSSSPTGSALVTSYDIPISSISNSAQWISFEFINKFQSVNGTYYCVVIEYLYLDTSNYIQIKADLTTKTHSGNAYTTTAIAETWVAMADLDLYFSVTEENQIIYANSTTDSGFTAGHPFASGVSTDYTVGRFNSSYASFYDGSATNGGVLNSTSNTKAGQSFIGNGKDLRSATFLLHREGSPTGNILCRLYAHTGTYGDYLTSRPTGIALATVTIDVATIPTSGNGDYTFTFDTSYPLVDGTPYYIMLEYSGGDASNLIRIYSTSANPTSGNKLTYYLDWTGSNPEDYYLKILTDEPIELTHETTYYWRARAIDPLGSNTYGSWSATRSFTTISAVSISVTDLAINVGDAWKLMAGAQINIGDAWKTVVSVKQNVGDVWKDVL